VAGNKVYVESVKKGLFKLIKTGADRMAEDEEGDARGTILAAIIGAIIGLLLILLLPPYPP